MLDWFNNKNRIIKEEVVIIAYIAKHDIIIPSLIKKLSITLNIPSNKKKLLNLRLPNYF
jgi:hypothetical protein